MNLFNLFENDRSRRNRARTVRDLFDRWTSSEYAPFNSDSGDHNEVIRKAASFLQDIVDPSQVERLAIKLSDYWHGEDGMELDEKLGSQLVNRRQAHALITKFKRHSFEEDDAAESEGTGVFDVGDHVLFKGHWAEVIEIDGTAATIRVPNWKNVSGMVDDTTEIDPASHFLELVPHDVSEAGMSDQHKENHLAAVRAYHAKKKADKEQQSADSRGAFNNWMGGSPEDQTDFMNIRKKGVAEGKKVDRFVGYVEKSEEKAGKSKKDAESIAWATANKRGMLDNKNKKKVKEDSVPLTNAEQITRDMQLIGRAQYERWQKEQLANQPPPAAPAPAPVAPAAPPEVQVTQDQIANHPQYKMWYDRFYRKELPNSAHRGQAAGSAKQYTDSKIKSLIQQGTDPNDPGPTPPWVKNLPPAPAPAAPAANTKVADQPIYDNPADAQKAPPRKAAPAAPATAGITKTAPPEWGNKSTGITKTAPPEWGNAPTGITKTAPPAETDAQRMNRPDMRESVPPAVNPQDGTVGQDLAKMGVSRQDRLSQAFIDKTLGAGKYTAGTAAANLALQAHMKKNSGAVAPAKEFKSPNEKFASITQAADGTFTITYHSPNIAYTGLSNDGQTDPPHTGIPTYQQAYTLVKQDFDTEQQATSVGASLQAKVNERANRSKPKSMKRAANDATGPKFGGYYKGTQKGAPRARQGFGSMEEGIAGNMTVRSDTLTNLKKPEDLTMKAADPLKGNPNRNNLVSAQARNLVAKGAQTAGPGTGAHTNKALDVKKGDFRKMKHKGSFDFSESTNFLAWAMASGYNVIGNPAVYESAKYEYNMLLAEVKKKVKEGVDPNAAAPAAAPATPPAPPPTPDDNIPDLKPGQYFVWRVYFDDGTKTRMKITDPKFDVKKYYSDKNISVINVDYNWKAHNG
jgi:hypothetical protein